MRGFLRRFWQRSCDHRGTPEAPGRVLALLRCSDVTDVDPSDRSDVVTRMAYEVEMEDWPAVLEALDIRERHGYTRSLLEFRRFTCQVLPRIECLGVHLQAKVPPG